MSKKCWPFIAWALLLVAAVTWPFFLPGDLVWRDMVILDSPGWTANNFGGGDLPARNSPQDGLLAIAGLAGLGGVLARVLVVGAAGAAAWAGYRFGRSNVGAAAAMLIAVINPFVVERLLQGQWSLAVAAWLLPAIAAAGLYGRAYPAWLFLCGAAITPTGGVFGLFVGVATMRNKRLFTAVIGAALCLPWVVPGILGWDGTVREVASASAFAPRAEEYAGTLGTLVGLGGIWNAAAVPASRAAGFALFGFLVAPLVVVGSLKLPRRTRAPLGTLAAVGLGVTLIAWLAPEIIAELLRTVPGAGLIRDSHKLVALAIPLYVAALGALKEQLAWAGLLCAALLVPDAPWELRVIRPAPTPATAVDQTLVDDLHGVDAFFADRGPLVRSDATVAVDPYAKAAAKVESGELTVDGELVDQATDRWLQAREAWNTRDLAALERLGIGAVVEGERIVAHTDAPPRPVPWALTVGWLLIPTALLAGAGASRSAGRSSPTRTARPARGRRRRAPRDTQGRR